MPTRYLRGTLCFTLLITLRVAVASASAEAHADAFWVWNRATPLTEQEISALQALGITKLFWHVGELNFGHAHWFWRSRISIPRDASLTITPVVRLDAGDRQALTGSSLTELRDILRNFANTNHIAELQLDFDCPDRLFGDYAAALAELKTSVSRLSATALAHWIDQRQFALFAANVAEIVPMFYDLQPDPPPRNRTPLPLPLIEPLGLRHDLSAWNNCPTPWRAGLPDFSRVTIYDSGARFRGHLRSWNWNEVCFNRALRVTSQSDGITLLHATAATSVGDTTVARDDWIAVRRPERKEIAAALRVLSTSKAVGVALFRLPDEADTSGWSLPQLQNLEETSAHLSLHREDNQFRLTNDSAADLPPRFGMSDDDRGYALEIDAPAPVWREAVAGDFWRVAAHVVRGNNAIPTAIPLATRLTFWFSHLRAGATLRTGLIDLAPNAQPTTLRYRILSAGDEPAQWHRLE